MKLPDDSTPVDDIPAVWKAHQKQQEEDHRRCTRAAIEDQQLTAERARAEYTAWQNKFKEKDALQLSLCDKVGKVDVINHGDVGLIDLSEMKDGDSPNKSDPPISPAAKWHQVKPFIYQKVKNEEVPTIVTADGGLALMVKTGDSPSLSLPAGGADEEDETH